MKQRTKCLSLIAFICLVLLMFPVSAFATESSDTTAPTVSDMSITSSNVSQMGVTLNWNKATDNTSTQTALEYLVYQSTSDNLDSVTNIETNGTTIGSYTADLATKDIAGLTADTTYYFNVIVKDEAGNKTCYTTKSITTLAAFTNGDGSSDHPYQIATAGQLTNMAGLLNNTATYDTYKDSYYLLTADINLSSQQWAPMANNANTTNSFLGTFDGNSHTVTLKAIDPIYEAYDTTMRTSAGLFGYIGDTGTVKNLTVKGDLQNSGAGDVYFGFIAARNSGTISNCSVEGTLTGSATATDVKNSGIYIGGITAVSLGSISDCTAKCTIDGTVSTNSKRPYLYLGGISGLSYGGNVEDCSAECTVTGHGTTESCTTMSYAYIGGLIGAGSTNNTITNCQAKSTTTDTLSTASAIQLNNYIGGLVGVNDISCSIENCSSTGNVEGKSTSGGNVYTYAGGLVGLNQSSSTIKDSFSSCTVKGDSATSGTKAYVYAGGLAGYNFNSADIQTSYADGDVSGKGVSAHVGGLIGTNYSASITNCYARGAVSGSGSSSLYFGGLLGDNYGAVSNCYATGAVSGSGTDVAGFTGYNDTDATISNGYFDKQTTGQTTGVGENDNTTGTVSATGLTSLKMTGKIAESNMSLDYSATWKTQQNTNSDWYYPQLQSVSDFDSVTLPVTVAPTGDGITPATGADIDGEQTFTFPFKTTKGTLTKLGLDLYLGDNTGESRDYSNAVQVNLPAGADGLNTLIDTINNAFKNATLRADLVTYFGEGNATVGEYSVRFFEAAGFRVGQDKAAAVKSNIQYTSSDGNVTGTWTLKLNTYMLKADKLEILTQVENSEGEQWGNNDYTHYGDLTKAFLYNLTQDTTAPTVSNILVTFTDNTTTTITKTPYGAEFLLCTKGKVVKNITVTMSKPVTIKKDAIISMEGTMGDCADAISSKTTYGTVSLDANDPSDKTLTVTPSGSNGTAGYLGEMKFYVDSDTVSDLVGNGNEEDSFYLIVGSKFNDVNSNVWYYNAITALSAAKIVQGIGNNMFDPAANITRADFLIMIMNMAEIKPATTWTDNFSDAGTNRYYSGYLAKAKELDIVNGVGNNMFAPNENITRQDMVTMMFNTLYNMALSESQKAKLNDLSAFSDRGDIANYAYFPFQFFVTYGVIAGEGNNMLCPQNLATRAEAAQMIYNLRYNGLDI